MPPLSANFPRRQSFGQHGCYMPRCKMVFFPCLGGAGLGRLGIGDLGLGGIGLGGLGLGGFGFSGLGLRGFGLSGFCLRLLDVGYM